MLRIASKFGVFTRSSGGNAALAALVLAVAIGTATGCSHHAEAPAAGHVKPFEVALLTPGPVSDAGWNAAAFDGLQLIKNRLGAETALVQTTSPADFEDAFRDFGGRGFDLIFAHGFEYTDTALKVAKLFPHTIIVVTSGSASSGNVASLTFKIEEAAYVLGVLAGGITRSGIAGAVGGIELPSIRLTFEGFRRGFVSARPSGRVLISYTGSFDDVSAAKEAALAEVSQGADILFHNADAAGLGVFRAAEQSHIYAFGSNRNQNDVAPDAVLASAVTDIPKAFLRIATEVKEGRFHPAMIEYGMTDGMVRVVYNQRLKANIAPAALARADAAASEIVAGKVALPTMPSGG
jgi:basic membrane protein A and related proteins